MDFLSAVLFSEKQHVCLMQNLFPANLQSRVNKGKMTQEKFERTISLLKGVLDYEQFKDVDMVIEVSADLIFVIKLFKCSSLNYLHDLVDFT